MKKIKIMLLSLALVAVVGGALAFKVRGTTTYCTAAVGASGTCDFACPNKKTGNPGGANFICTTIPRDNNGVLVCTDASNVKLPCETSIQVILD
jgi:hypothetical protein